MNFMCTVSAVPVVPVVSERLTFVVGREVYKLKDIQRYCKTKIYAQPIPSLNDITTIRLKKCWMRSTISLKTKT